MLGLIISQLFAPFDYAVGTWYMRNGSLSHSGVQALKGAVTGPNIKCSYSGLTGEGDPLVADINGDGLNEIVFSSYSPPTLWAFRGSDCSLLWSYPLTATSWGTASIGKLLPYEPGLQIVATDWNAHVFAVRGTNGTLIWSRVLDSPYLQSSVAIYDVDGDGSGEVFVHSTSNIYALRGTDGTTIWSYPAPGRYNSPSIYDVNNDSQLEVITISSSGTLIVLRATNGSVVYTTTLSPSEGSPSVADINGDGLPEIVVGTSGGMVYALRGTNGSILWNTSVGGNVHGTPSIYDINGDGLMEVVVGRYVDYTNDRVYVLRGTDGGVLWFYTRTASWEQSLARKLGDVDNDGDIEIVITSYGSRVGTSPQLVILNGRTGTVEWTYDIPSNGLEGASIADVDNDGCMEILVVPDWTSSGGLKVFDSSTPITDCGVLGYDDPVSVNEENSSGYHLKVRRMGDYITVETGRDATILVFSTSGRMVNEVKTVKGKANIKLAKGVYILKIKGHKLYKTLVVK